MPSNYSNRVPYITPAQSCAILVSQSHAGGSFLVASARAGIESRSYRRRRNLELLSQAIIQYPLQQRTIQQNEKKVKNTFNRRIRIW